MPRVSGLGLRNVDVCFVFSIPCNHHYLVLEGLFFLTCFFFFLATCFFLVLSLGASSNFYKKSSFRVELLQIFTKHRVFL